MEKVDSLLKELDLSGKKALVTGAGQSIGKAIALRLARHGAVVGVNDIDQANAEQTAKEIGELGRESCVLAADVSKTKEIDAMFDALFKRFGTIHILVNAVGPGDVETAMMEREWRQAGERLGVPASQVKEEYRKRLILGDFQKPDHIARAVLFLCSSLADQVTASHLIVSGGLPFARE